MELSFGAALVGAGSADDQGLFLLDPETLPDDIGVGVLPGGIPCRYSTEHASGVRRRPPGRRPRQPLIAELAIEYATRYDGTEERVLRWLRGHPPEEFAPPGGAMVIGLVDGQPDRRCFPPVRRRGR